MVCRVLSAKPLQGRFYGYLERRQIVFNHDPYTSNLDPVVFVSQVFPMPRICGQGTPGQRLSAASPIFFAASLIRSRHRSAALVVLGSCKKAAWFIPAVKSSIRRMICRMSSKRWIGSFEGTQGLSADAALHARLERSFLDQVYPLPQQFGQRNFDAGNILQRDSSGLIESGQ
jgi:hypothetical protein